MDWYGYSFLECKIKTFIDFFINCKFLVEIYRVLSFLKSYIYKFCIFLLVQQIWNLQTKKKIINLYNKFFKFLLINIKIKAFFSFLKNRIVAFAKDIER